MLWLVSFVSCFVSFPWRRCGGTYTCCLLPCAAAPYWKICIATARPLIINYYQICCHTNFLSSIAGDDIRQKLEFHHTHLELGALGYIETFLFYWSWGFFQKKTPPRPIFVFENTRVPPLDLKKYFFLKSPQIIFLSKPLDCIRSHDSKMV